MSLLKFVRASVERCGIESHGSAAILRPLTSCGLDGCDLDRKLQGTIMNTHLTRHNQAPKEKLHPIIYRLIIGLAAWLVLSIWLLFDRGSYVVLILAVITTFFFIAVGVPLIIAFTWWHNSGAREQSEHAIRFREWLACEFTTRTGALSAKAAAIQILLPIAAVSIGMTVFGLVLHFDLPNLG